MASIQYGKRACTSDFDRRPSDKNGVGSVSITSGKGKLGGKNGNAASQSKKQGTGRGQ